MTKSDIVKAVYEKVGGFSKKEAADLVDLVFETMKETLGRGEKIKISGYGNFVLRDKHPRKGRNPQTGDPITISDRRVLTFKASQILKHALNSRHGSNADTDGGVDASPAAKPEGNASESAKAGSDSTTNNHGASADHSAHASLAGANSSGAVAEEKATG
jgi:integration host factor subunit alpha